MPLTKDELQKIDRDIINTGKATVPDELLPIMSKGAANIGKAIVVQPAPSRPGWSNVEEIG